MTFKLENLITEGDRQEDEAGITLDDISAALTTLVGMRTEPLSVAAAAAFFGCQESVILAAVENGYWLSADGDRFDTTKCMIEVDGE
jgi:uncharacterized membrane protein